MNDVETLTKAVEDSQKILVAYLMPDGTDANTTISKLLSILDHTNVVDAVRRLSQQKRE